MNTKKNKAPRALGAAVVALVLALTVTVLAHSYLRIQAQTMDDSFRQLLDFTEDAQQRVEAGGVSALAGIAGSGYTLGQLDSDGWNAVLADDKGHVLAQTGTLATEGQDHLTLVVAEHSRTFEDWSYREDGLFESHQMKGRLGLMLDGEGNILRTFMATDDSGKRMVGDLLASQYRSFFPSVPQDVYNQAAHPGGGGWEWDDEAPVQAQSQEVFEKVEELVAWENEQMAGMGQLRAYLMPLTGAQEGRTLVLFYLSNDAMHSQDIERARVESWADGIAFLRYPLLAALWMVLVLWVFRDARYRNFKPALWGVLTLLGSVVAWLIYLIVRPDSAAQSACPDCGCSLKSGYAFCPDCGRKQKNRCPCCLKAVEEGWNHCPYCGTALKTPAEKPQEAGLL